MTRDIDDLRHPERCPTCWWSRDRKTTAEDYPRSEYNYFAACIECKQPRPVVCNNDTCYFLPEPATDSLPEVEEVYDWEVDIEALAVATSPLYQAPPYNRLRSHISSLTEEVERLRERAENAERILLSGDYTVEVVANIEADRDEYCARMEWLAQHVAKPNATATTIQYWLTASLSAVKEDQ